MIVRFLSLPEAAEAPAPAAGWLDPDESARARAFRFAADRQSYIAAHALLRATLSEAFARAGHPAPSDWRFRAGTHGKPQLVAGQAAGHASFNLSHSRGMVAVAIAADCEVGIDVEALARRVSDDAAIARRHFTPGEQAALERRADPEERRRTFLAFWTAKEAFIKATGRGLSLPLDRFEVDLAACRYAHVSPDCEAAALDWTLARWNTPTHLVALAAGRMRASPAPRIDGREVHWDAGRATYVPAAVASPPVACTAP